MFEKLLTQSNPLGRSESDKNPPGRGGATLLDYSGQNSTQSRKWNRKQKRAYHRIKSGFAKHHGEILRFLTLTTPLNPKVELHRGFEMLHERIRRRRWGFDYLAIRTAEGANGVYHILYFGDFIPQKWLSENWEEIIGACVVDIRATRRGVKNKKRLSAYVIRQYISGQPFERYSCSEGWVFGGFVGVWEALKRRWKHKEYKYTVKFLAYLFDGHLAGYWNLFKLGWLPKPGVL